MYSWFKWVHHLDISSNTKLRQSDTNVIAYTLVNMINISCFTYNTLVFAGILTIDEGSQSTLLQVNVSPVQLHDAGQSTSVKIKGQNKHSFFQIT